MSTDDHIYVLVKLNLHTCQEEVVSYKKTKPDTMTWYVENLEFYYEEVKRDE